MPFQTIPNVNRDYALLLFDDQGHERTDDPEGGVFSPKLIKKVRAERPSDIFLFSHGWKGDVPSAIDQYNRWIGAMWKLDADRARVGPAFRPLFIGLHWPSQPWGEEAVAAAVSFGVSASGNQGLAGMDALREAAVAHFGGDERVRGPLTTIFNAYANDPAARELPPEVIQAYKGLANAIGFAANDSAGGAPDEDGAALDPQKAVRAEHHASAGASFGLFSSIKNGILAGLRQTSFWLMKHRARTVGEQGMHQFVANLQRTSDARIHLMGHSFGCIVVSSILNGPEGHSILERPVDSAVLVQGALSLWSFADRIKDSARPGYFQGVSTRRAVAGPFVTTQSAHDAAVGFAYPAAVGLVDEVDFATVLPLFGGVGSFGIQGTEIAEAGVMLDENGVYNFKPNRIYNLDGSPFIPSHTGIDGPQVAHLLWQAAFPATPGGLQ